MRGLRAGCEAVEHLQTFLLSVFADGLPQRVLVAGLMLARVEYEAPALSRTVDGPAGEHLGQLDHVMLGISAVHAQRVQLQELARVVLVQSALSIRRFVVASASSLRVGTDALPIVEIEKHRRGLGGGNQQITKLAQSVWTDGIALVGGGVMLVGVFVYKNVEVIEPEIGHHFEQLALAVQGTK